MPIPYYLITVILCPRIGLMMEARFGWERQSSWWLRSAALPVGILGAALQGWCIALFQRIGRGTPSPGHPPMRLVTVGPYRHVRNPMNIGEIMVVVALAGWFGSASLLIYALLAWCTLHGFIVAWQEPGHLQKWGDEYARYCKTVNRWTPALRRGK